MNKEIGYLKRAWRYFKPYKKQLILYSLIGFIYSLLGVLLPLLSAKIVEGITNNTVEIILLFAIIYFIFRGSTALFGYLIDVLYYKITGKVIFDIRADVTKSILDLEVKNFDKNNSGMFIKRMDSDPFEIAWIFNSIRITLTSTITNIGIFFMIFIINIYMGLFFIIALIPIFILQKKRISYRNKTWKEFKNIHDENSAIFQEALKGVRDIKVLNLKLPFMNHTLNSLDKSYKKKKTIEIKNSAYWSIDNVIKEVIKFLFIILGLFLLKENQITTTSFLVLYMYKEQLFVLVSNLSELGGDLKEFEVSAKRIFEVTDNTLFSKETFGNKSIKKLKGNIEFKNVTFKYEDKNILKEFNLKINENDTVAIVGKSGEGKSTIFNLLSKLYEINSGDILYDNVSIKELNENTIRKNISIITQDPYLFNLTIKENLLLVKSDLTNSQMIEKCKQASIHDYIMTLDKKYNTKIGEDGVTLSGGQKQRLAIARALIKESEIILFDEATSALDNETQKEIQNAIKNIRKDYTILIIAHRLSTIAFCNKIVVISQGKVNGTGSHTELMKNNKIYKDLYDKEEE